MSEATTRGPSDYLPHPEHFIMTPHKFKDIYLAYLMKRLKHRQGVIFTKSTMETKRCAVLLVKLGFSVLPIWGGLSHAAWRKSVDTFRTHPKTILIATDLGAGGLELPPMDFVIDFEFPLDNETYNSRVETVTRNGNIGIVISLISQMDTDRLMYIESKLGRRLQEYLPD